MYELILLLEKESDSSYNPSFLFDTMDQATEYGKVMIESGYMIAITKLNEEV